MMFTNYAPSYTIRTAEQEETFDEICRAFRRMSEESREKCKVVPFPGGEREAPPAAAAKGTKQWRITLSNVMKIGNHIWKESRNRSLAMLKAWALVKMPLIETNVAGVTFGNRQRALEHLRRYPNEEITLTLLREPYNPYDANAIAVIASVEGKGGYQIGYVPKHLAKLIAPIMDAGRTIEAFFQDVTGIRGRSLGVQFGLKLT